MFEGTIPKQFKEINDLIKKVDMEINQNHKKSMSLNGNLKDKIETW